MSMTKQDLPEEMYQGYEEDTYFTEQDLVELSELKEECEKETKVFLDKFDQLIESIKL